ncbi:MAG: dihydropteroate synthase [Crocinitomicaceae bacterium]|nr:dihydropteroate synthase [Crocinitomicaceae bacterium]MDP5067177.1 dihydropteroate synthase [Crocinitomicaceae bacterium]
MSQAKEQSTVFQKSRFLNIKGQLHDFGQPKIMGILNMTPDSFYEKSRVLEQSQLLERAHAMITAGADILDLGASSTRPDAPINSPQEEMDRLADNIQLLKKAFPDTLLSLDTYYGAVAQFGIAQGIDLINDISAGQFDPTLWPVVAEAKIPYILNYNRAQQNNSAQSFLKEKGIVSDALSFLSEKRAALQALGCTDVLIDPGFGFGKSLAENHELLHKLEHLHLLGAPLLVGVSRKSMITKVLNCTAQDALNGTSILNTLAYSKGARIFRVHDIAAVREMILLLAAQDLH